MPPVRRSGRNKAEVPAQKLADKLSEHPSKRKRRKTKSDDSLNQFETKPVVSNGNKENQAKAKKSRGSKQPVKQEFNSKDQLLKPEPAKYEPDEKFVPAKYGSIENYVPAATAVKDETDRKTIKEDTDSTMVFNSDNALAMLMQFESKAGAKEEVEEEAERAEGGVMEMGSSDDDDEGQGNWENVKEASPVKAKKPAKRKAPVKKLTSTESAEDSDFEHEKPSRKRKKPEPKVQKKESTQTAEEKVVDNFIKKCLVEREVCLEQCYLATHFVRMKKVMQISSNSLLKGLFYSTLPSAFHGIPTDVESLNKLVTWYRENFALSDPADSKPKSLYLLCLQLCSDRHTSSQITFVIGFQIIARLLGYTTRYLSSLHLPSLEKLKGKPLAPKAKLKLLDNTELTYADIVHDVDHWLECELGEEFVSVDVCNGVMSCDRFIEVNATQALGYILAIFENYDIVDITPKYVLKWASAHRKIRLHNIQYWDDLIKERPSSDEAAVQGHYELMKRMMVERGFPVSMAGFKHNLVFVIEQHILKVEGLYPKEPQVLGLFKGFNVYSTDCVRQLKQEIVIKKEGRAIMEGQEPWKVVRNKLMFDRYPGDDRWKEVSLYGDWQTERYRPATAQDGVVPRNEFGNVEMFKPWMLPVGCSHVDLPGSYSVARKLGVDASHAVTGFEFKKGRCVPVMAGVVVCKDNEDTLRDAWEIHSADQALKAEEKRVKRVYESWKLLIRGLLIKEKLARKADQGLTKGHVHKFSKKTSKDKITGEMVKKCSCGLIVPVDEEEEL